MTVVAGASGTVTCSGVVSTVVGATVVVGAAVVVAAAVVLVLAAVVVACRQQMPTLPVVVVARVVVLPWVVVVAAVVVAPVVVVAAVVVAPVVVVAAVVVAPVVVLPHPSFVRQMLVCTTGALATGWASAAGVTVSPSPTVRAAAAATRLISRIRFSLVGCRSRLAADGVH